MCELFGYSSNQKAQLQPFLKTFFSHSNIHKDGWGIFYEDVLIKEELCANDSQILPNVLEQIPEVDTFLGHIRLASVGSIKIENCHPFTMVDKSNRKWIQIHNGTIFESEELEKYRNLQKGSTDSERILLYLQDKINELNDEKINDCYERFYVVEKMLEKLSKNNKLNYMVYDGEYFYVHTNMKHTLYERDYMDGKLFSTTPLEEENWCPLELNTLQVYKKGEIRYKGKLHKNEYIQKYVEI